MLADPLPIQPFTRPVRGELALPGSKSLTNRALLLAALCQSPVELTGALFSEDTHLMVTALRQLGFSVASEEPRHRLVVSDQQRGFHSGDVDIFVGLAGTAARFLTAFCAAAPQGHYRIDGVEQMRRRPMKGLIDALRSLGADITCTGEAGFFPIEIQAHGLRGGLVSIDASESSQLLSALLMVAPKTEHALEIELLGSVRWPFVQMTSQLMQEFGQDPLTRVNDARFVVNAGSPYQRPTGEYPIEPDATAASYFLALPLATGGQLSLQGVRGAGAGLQGDAHFQTVLQQVGLSLTADALGVNASYDRSVPRRGVTADFNQFSDTFLTLAAIAPLLDGPTRITGIAHTRKQETDRVAGMARELTKLGQQVIEKEDSLEIHPQPLRVEQTIETYRDHRFAMSFGVLGSYDLRGDGRPWLRIADPSCCAKTFPNFFELLSEVRQRSVGI